jgi:hypothetical protein
LESLGGPVSKHTKSPSAPAWLKTLASGCAGVLVIGYLLLLMPGSLTPVTETSGTILLSRAGVRTEAAKSFKESVELMQRLAPPDRSILCLPYQPMIYFLCQRRNPTRWNYLWPGDQTPDDHKELIRQAKSDPPAVVLITEESEMASYAPAILDYVRREYTRRQVAGSYTIYLP